MGSKHHSHPSRVDAVLRGKTNQELGRLFPQTACTGADGTRQSSEMSDVFRKIKEVPEKEAAELFGNKILPMYVVFLFYFIL